MVEQYVIWVCAVQVQDSAGRVAIIAPAYQRCNASQDTAIANLARLDRSPRVRPPVAFSAHQQLVSPPAPHPANNQLALHPSNNQLALRLASNRPAPQLIPASLHRPHSRHQA